MNRIVYLCLKMNFSLLYYLTSIGSYAKKKNKTKEDYVAVHKIIKKGCTTALKAGRISVDVKGIENIPKEDGFIFYPNHQGLLDVLIFFVTCPNPFAFVIKKEASNIILLKQVIGAVGSYAMDRKDIKQSLEVIKNVAKDVMNGMNFIIFAEGTRSKMGNKLLDMKGGSFKAATIAKCPIVPCALIDSYVPFDIKGTNPVTVSIRYLKPIPYEEYKDMKATEIAAEVKRRIEEAIAEVEGQKEQA